MYKFESGFLPDHSTTFQLIDIYHHICQANDTNQFCMVFCDVIVKSGGGLLAK